MDGTQFTNLKMSKTPTSKHLNDGEVPGTHSTAGTNKGEETLTLSSEAEVGGSSVTINSNIAQGSLVQLGSSNRGEEASAFLPAGKVLEPDGGSLHKAGNAFQMCQGSGSQGSQNKEHLNAGKLPMSRTRASSAMPSREQLLKQLRAQCLVFLAFRNGLVPRKLHLEIALGDNYTKEDAALKEVNDQKGEVLISKNPTSINEAASTFERSNDVRETDRIPSGCSPTGTVEADSSSKETENQIKNVSQTDPLSEEKKWILAARNKSEHESEILETADSQVESDSFK